jgi:hypothetical protein
VSSLVINYLRSNKMFCRKVITVSLFISLFFIDCFSEKSSMKTIIDFRFESLSMNGVIYEKNKTISVVVPKGTDVTALAPTITHTGESISPYPSAVQNFSSPVTYTVTADDGSAENYTVTVIESDIPVLMIDTPDSVAVTSTEVWVENAYYKLVDNTGTVLENTTAIKGRGFSTWNFMPKKPYSIKLDKKPGLQIVKDGPYWQIMQIKHSCAMRWHLN